MNISTKQATANLRSWDRKAEQLPNDRNTSPGTSRLGAQNFWKNSKKVRVVAWPEGAPPQDQIPHAGTLVRRKKTTPGQIPGVTFTVATGIPYEYGNEWYLRVFTSNDKDAIIIQVTDLELISDKITTLAAPRLYSEDDIRAAVGGDHLADSIMESLNS